MKFVNPFFAKARRIAKLETDLELSASCTRALLQTSDIHRETTGKLREEVTRLEGDVAFQASVIDVQREINGRNRDHVRNLETLCDRYTLTIRQDEQGLMFHMEEREDLLDTIDDLEDEAEDLVDVIEECVRANSKQAEDIKLLNELLVEGSATYAAVVAAGQEMAEEFDRRIAEAREEANTAAKNEAVTKWAYENSVATMLGAEQDRDLFKRERDALKLANTQSLSWVRQAAEALDAYGITIEDTPIGPTVQIDTEALVNRLALDSVAQA